MRIELVIGTLALDGVELDASGRRAFEAALREEIGRAGRFAQAVLPRIAAPAAGRDGGAFGRALGRTLTAQLGWTSQP